MDRKAPRSTKCLLPPCGLRDCLGFFNRLETTQPQCCWHAKCGVSKIIGN